MVPCRAESPLPSHHELGGAIAPRDASPSLLLRIDPLAWTASIDRAAHTACLSHDLHLRLLSSVRGLGVRGHVSRRIVLAEAVRMREDQTARESQVRPWPNQRGRPHSGSRVARRNNGVSRGGNSGSSPYGESPTPEAVRSETPTLRDCDRFRRARLLGDCSSQGETNHHAFTSFPAGLSPRKLLAVTL